MEKYLSIVREIVQKHIDPRETTVFLFGSRAAGKASPHSDIDVGLYEKSPLSALVLSDIAEELEESIVPYKVDVVDFSKVDDNFKKIALKDIEIWNQPDTALPLQ